MAGSGPIPLQSPALTQTFEPTGKVEVTSAPSSPPLPHVAPGSCLLVGTAVALAPQTDGQGKSGWSQVQFKNVPAAYLATIFNAAGEPNHQNATADANGKLTASTP